VVVRVQFWFSSFWKDESAQGITEYGAIIAFVSVLVAIALGIASGQMLPALSAAFSSIAQQLDSMASTAANASS
jgi:Flp pilus assembly pilin Flp